METLLNLPLGVKAQVMGIRSGFGMQRHLMSLGIMPGKIIKKITSQPVGGPIMLEVGGARIAIGRQIASRVIVRRILL